MTTLVGVVAPIFGIMALGYLAVKSKGLDEGAVRGLVLYVFNFAIPAMLFRSLSRMELPPDVEWSFLISFFGGAFTVYGLGVAAGRFWFRRTLADQAIFGMSSGFSNTVLMGIPILLTAYGPEATLPTFLIIGFHAPTLMPLTTGLIQLDRGGRSGLAKRIESVLRELFRNPIILALLLGFIANRVGVELWAPADRAIEMLGATAVPCALFTLGAALGSYPLTGDVPPAVLLMAVKLVVHPALVWILAVPVFGLEGIWVKVAVTMAAMPTGINAYLFGARYEAAPGVAARTIFLSTLISVFTISGILILFGP
jgi:predicted permease